MLSEAKEGSAETSAIAAVPAFAVAARSSCWAESRHSLRTVLTTGFAGQGCLLIVEANARSGAD